MTDRFTLSLTTDPPCCDWPALLTHARQGDLLESSLGRAILAEMARDPHRCAEAYNDAVERHVEAGIAPLLVRDDYVEMPMWRIRDDGRRMHAYDNDIAPWLEGRSEVSSVAVDGFVQDEWAKPSKIEPPFPRNVRAPAALC